MTSTVTRPAQFSEIAQGINVRMHTSGRIETLREIFAALIEGWNGSRSDRPELSAPVRSFAAILRSGNRVGDLRAGEDSAPAAAVAIAEAYVALTFGDAGSEDISLSFCGSSFELTLRRSNTRSSCTATLSHDRDGWKLRLQGRADALNRIPSCSADLHELGEQQIWAANGRKVDFRTAIEYWTREAWEYEKHDRLG